MTGNERTIGSVDAALDNLEDMDRGEDHDHSRSAAHVDKFVVHSGTDHVDENAADVLQREIRWRCTRCGEDVDRVYIRNNA